MNLLISVGGFMEIFVKHWSIEALFIKAYLPEYVSLFADIEKIDNSVSLNELRNTKIAASISKKYHEVKMQEPKGKLEATTQFWFKIY